MPKLNGTKNWKLYRLMENVIFEDLGRVSYQKAWEYQQLRLKEVIEIKLHNRHLEKNDRQPLPHRLLFCEHPPVYTLGRNGDLNNLLLNEKGLAEKGIEFYKINRGGDITYHGLGQIVGYPIFDLDCFFTDVHRYVRYLEEAVIRTIGEYGLQGERLQGATGVWLDTARQPRKICAIGIHLSRWVTMHGFAFNVNTDLEHFGYIIPCGIQDKGVTSMEVELGKKMNLEEVKSKLKHHLQALFEFQYRT